MGALLLLCPPGVFNSQTCLHWASSNSSITVQIFLPHPWFPRQFLPVSLCSDKLWCPAFACLSLWSSEQWFALSSLLTDARKVVDFSVYSDLFSLFIVDFSKYLQGETTKYWVHFMWFTSLRDFCHLTPSYSGITSMSSTAVYFALYLDLKIFLGSNAGLLQAILFWSDWEIPCKFHFMRDRITYSNNSRIRKICYPSLALSLANFENLTLFT